MMCPTVIRIVIDLPVAMLDLHKGPNRKMRRSAIFGKGNKKIREWGYR